MNRQEKLDAIAASLTEFDWQQYVELPDSYDRYDQARELAEEILSKLERGNVYLTCTYYGESECTLDHGAGPGVH